MLVIKLLSLTAFYILVCDLGAGAQQTVFLSASCLLLGLYNEERWETGGRLRETHFLSTAVPSSVTSGMTLHASGQQQLVPVVISYDFLSVCLFYSLTSQIRDTSTATPQKCRCSSIISSPEFLRDQHGLDGTAAVLGRCGSQPCGNPALSSQRLMADCPLGSHWPYRGRLPWKSLSVISVLFVFRL